MSEDRWEEETIIQIIPTTGWKAVAGDLENGKPEFWDLYVIGWALVETFDKRIDVEPLLFCRCQGVMTRYDYEHFTKTVVDVFPATEKHSRKFHEQRIRARFPGKTTEPKTIAEVDGAKVLDCGTFSNGDAEREKAKRENNDLQ